MKARRCIGVFGVLLGVLSGAPAQAAFRGANGSLAAQPVSSRGVLIIDPRTGSTRRICQVSSQCGRLVSPKWARMGGRSRLLILRAAG
jgi:hypothetical protein